MKILALGGAPATGKSTLVQAVLKQCGAYTTFEWGTCKGQLYEDDQLLVLGRYAPDLDFGGTDALAMSAQPDCIDFVDEAATSDQYNDFTLLFEGDRLYNESFLSYCEDHDHIQLEAWCLVCDEATLEQRHEDRDDSQSESWLQGRKTKYENLLASDLPIEPKENEDKDDFEHLTTTLQSEVGVATTP